MRRVVSAALVALVVAASARARAETGVIDTGSDAFGVDVGLDTSLDASLDSSLDGSLDAGETAEETAPDAEPDTSVDDTFAADTFVAPDTAPDAADTKPIITVLDSAGPILDHVNDGGWDPRGRSPTEGDACQCDVVGSRGRATSTFAALLPLLAVVLRRRRR